MASATSALTSTVVASLGSLVEYANRVTATLPIPESALRDFTWRSKRGAATIVIGYLLLVRSLRFQRERSLKKKYKYNGSRASLAKMTAAEAQEIVQAIGTYEMPQMQALSLELGLFKTYGIESISKLLVATRNLADPKNSPKRYEDTGTIILEFMSWHPTSERATKAIARMNFLHSKYVANGTISNDDLLYTLSVFVIEPIRFAEHYDWRPLNDMERCAIGVFWKSVGDAMGIEYRGCLPGAETGWRDGLQFVEEVAAWSSAYEVAKMKPNPVSPKPAHALIPMLTYWVPPLMKGFVTECIISLVNDRIREAFLLPEPNISAVAFVHSALVVRRFVIRYLMLPRIFRLKALNDAPDPETGRYLLPHAKGNYPFYIKPTLWNRWGPVAWGKWALGAKVPGDVPGEYMPQGYTFDDIGPVNRANQGVEEMAEDAKRLRASGRGGCPF